MTVEAASGFVYATAVMGVTGAARADQQRSASSSSPGYARVTDKPVGVGLGVSQRRPGPRDRRVTPTP